MEKGGLSMWPVRKKEREPFSAQDGMEEWKRREKTAAFCGGGEGDPLSPLPATVSDPFGRRRRMGDEEEAG